MRSLAFIDTHVHFHDHAVSGVSWDWLKPGAPPVPETVGDYGEIQSQRYMAEDFIAETRFQQVAGVVHVQAAVGTPDPVAETRWLQAQADRVGAPQGIIAHADLSAPDLETTLARHAESSNLRGIRDLRYDGYLADDAWVAGIAALERHGLVLCDDPLVEHMGLLANAAAQYPGVTICIDHAGFPRRRDSEYFRQWRDGMTQLAARENTVVKISGLGMCDHTWTVESIRPWVQTCIELWGPSRACFGTNWPVDRLFSSYGDVLDAYFELIADHSADEREQLFSGTARRIFGLSV
jgi:predicted TIM-barrel fold metal-dependent hydrolase